MSDNWRNQPPTHLLRLRVGYDDPRVSWCGVAESECRRVTTLEKYTTCKKCKLQVALAAARELTATVQGGTVGDGERSDDYKGDKVTP